MATKLTSFLKAVIITLFVAFFALYLSQATGYYAFEQQKKTALTEEQIKKFEADVKEGKNIDINEYLQNTSKDYQSKTSEFGLKISITIGNIARKGIEETFKVLGKLVE